MHIITSTNIKTEEYYLDSFEKKVKKEFAKRWLLLKDEWIASEAIFCSKQALTMKQLQEELQLSHLSTTDYF